MAKKVMSRTTKVCAMCRYWNNGRGGVGVNLKNAHFFEVETSEKQMCYKKGINSPAWSRCPDFESNY